MQQCPACNYELTMAEQTAGEGKCPNCGVYFAKYQARMQREAGGLDAVDRSPPSAPARPVTSVAQSAKDFRNLPGRGPVPVVVTDIEMRFGSMVVFMVKWALAAIPALMILTALVVVLFVMMGAMFGSAQAQQVYRCTDANGHTTFSQQACPDGTAGQGVTVNNPPPSGGGDVVPWGRTGAVPPAQERSAPRVTVVGAPKKCGPATDQEIRSAVINKKVFVGMTTEQAIKSWGRPIKINRSSHGSDQWVYNSRYLYIEDGCVVSWN